MKGIFKQRGKKLTAVATAFALLCTAGAIPGEGIAETNLSL